MSFDLFIYGLCSVSYILLIILILLRGQANGRGLTIVAASLLTALWAADLSADLLSTRYKTILDTIRLSAWLLILVSLVSQRRNEARASAFSPLLLAASFSAAVIGCNIGILFDEHLAAATAAHINLLLHLGLSIGGLLAAENVLRNVDSPQRRNVSPLCFALGSAFAFELFLYANLLLLPNSSPILPEGRGVISLAAVPFIALTIARNREWRVDIHVSREVVLHTAALLSSGILFLVLSALGVLARRLGDGWGPFLQVAMLLGSALVLIYVIGTRELRIFLKNFISRNFFSHRFDYRAEWLRFVDTVSNPDSHRDDLANRIIRALAQIIDSHAGMLWRLGEHGDYFPERGWNVPINTSDKLQPEDPLILDFRDGDWIQLHPAENKPSPFEFQDAWIAIPLSHDKQLIGFLILLLPKGIAGLDAETFELLRAAAKQAASYLAEEQSTRALSDAKALTEFSKRFAFVAHDIKNLASQLDLVVNNARRHFDNPEFREDMLQTLEEAVSKLNHLMGRLRADPQRGKLNIVELDVIISRVIQELSADGSKIETHLDAPGCIVAIDGDHLRSVLQHAVNNAREAAGCDGGELQGAVMVRSRSVGKKVIIEVIDSGPGMDEKFVREDLFKPFRSTKTDGMGIGAYQIRELLRSSGGDLDVISRKGSGTIMRMTLPSAIQSSLASTAA